MPTSILPDGTFRTAQPVSLPDVLDLLVVGGGPAGTATAFRAKELGLSALVIDFDDLMKRIRDYAKDKLILPHFGGGDKMKFPLGGPLVQNLHFSDIDKDDMCTAWKSFYHQNNIPARIGLELTGMRRGTDLWHVKVWNHRTKQEENLRARHVVIAIGRGVPRRFDIPGNTDGIAYRMDDAAKYVGTPACVVGGGTSAAEAVIAISNAKAEAEDECPVYWSYRGDKMPKVSKALADVFFDAYVGNGNIRYYPNSEPVAVLTGPDRRDYLSLRIDRKEMGGRPSETSHLEFRKEYCIACIGEDIPERFLNSLGIYMATGGPKMKKRMVVTPLLETQQPNVYLIGDILSQAYLETDNFDGDPALFREVKHRGNIKSALRDGVYVAEVVRQKIEGRQRINVVLDFAEDAPASPPSGPAERASESFLMSMLSPSGGPPRESIPENRAVIEEHAFLVRLTQGEVEEEEFPLRAYGVTSIGRRGTDLLFTEDSLLSEQHASISHTPDGFFLRDDGSETGTFFQLQPGLAIPVVAGDLIRLGRQFLLFGYEDGAPFFVHYDHRGTAVRRYPLHEGTVVAGRQAPDIVLNADDKVMSRRHISIAVKQGQINVKDLNSLNHTYLRVRDAIKLAQDDVFRVGQQIFRLNLADHPSPPAHRSAAQEAPPAPAAPRGYTSPPPLERPGPRRMAAPPAPAPTPRQAMPAPAPRQAMPVPVAPVAPAPPAPAPSGPPAVTFRGLGKAFPLSPGKSICDAAEAGGVALNAECHAGICGSDPIRIVSGSQFLSPVADDEAETLEDICGLKAGNAAGQCRLACMAKATGPVVVERVEA